MISFLVLEVGMLGVFLALDLFLFYIFWEIVLVPMYLIIGIWGGAEPHLRDDEVRPLHARRLAADAGGDPGHGVHATRPATGTWDGAFDLLTLARRSASTRTLQLLCFVAFFLAFAIKVPMWPFHTWLPDAHVEAPTAGSVILAGVLLKLGGYGFIRFALPLYPQAAHDLAGIIIVLSLIAIIYGAIVAIVQPDLKKLVAYSSVSHMGFVTLGIFVFQQQGMQGAVLQMVNHGIITGALFLCVGVIYERTHDRTHRQDGRARRRAPRCTRRCSASSCSPASACPASPGSWASSWCSLGTFAVSPRRGRHRDAGDGLRAACTCCGCTSAWCSASVSDFLKGLGHHLTDIDPDRGADARAAGRADAAVRPLPGHRARLHPARRSTDLLAPGRRATTVTGVRAMTTNEWLAIAPFLIVVGLAMLVVIVDLDLAEPRRGVVTARRARRARGGDGA